MIRDILNGTNDDSDGIVTETESNSSGTNDGRDAIGMK